VDDSEHDIEFVCRVLRKEIEQVEITVASDGKKALEILEGSDPKDFPSLVLLDIMMPGIDGMQILEQLKCFSNLNCIPVVVLSTFQELQIVKSSYRFGANAYVAKSFDHVIYKKRLQSLARFWLGFNRTLTTTL